MRIQRTGHQPPFTYNGSCWNSVLGTEAYTRLSPSYPSPSPLQYMLTGQLVREKLLMRVKWKLSIKCHSRIKTLELYFEWFPYFFSLLYFSTSSLPHLKENIQWMPGSILWLLAVFLTLNLLCHIPCMGCRFWPFHLLFWLALDAKREYEKERGREGSWECWS